jgi:hypothetical protein
MLFLMLLMLRKVATYVATFLSMNYADTPRLLSSAYFTDVKPNVMSRRSKYIY